MTNTDNSRRELGLRLHEQLLAGDPTATARIAEEFLPYVESRLSLRFPRLDDPHFVQTAVEDAIIGYLKNPRQFDPEKSSLQAYLYMSAKGDLLNALGRTRAEPQKVNLIEDVELEDGETEKGVEIPAPYDLWKEVLTRISPVPDRLDTLFPDPIDRKLVELILDGERDTGEFAAVLGIQGLAAGEQAKAVKRHKDRLKKMMQRHQTELLKDE